MGLKGFAEPGFTIRMGCGNKGGAKNNVKHEAFFTGVKR